jgi:Zn finger protein HypA/HybF involved in hydrogenase expression
MAKAPQKRKLSTTAEQRETVRRIIRATLRMLQAAHGIPPAVISEALSQVAEQMLEAQDRSVWTGVKRYACLRCGHTWYPSQLVVNICPKCKSALWQTARTNRQGLRPESRRRIK